MVTTSTAVPAASRRLLPRAAGGAARRPGEAGYNLIILIIAVSVLTILLSLALPLWSQWMQREKEEELIFRGLQYAEAIRVFRNRFGRPPVRLEELLEVKPRSIRRLWKDPMTASGQWALIFEGANTNRNPAARNGGTDLVTLPQGADQGDENQPVQVGPIAGVRSRSSDDSVKVLFDSQKYDRWMFTYQIFAGVNSGAFGVPNPNLKAPSLVKSQWIGRPFRPGIGPVGNVPQAALPQGNASPTPQGQSGFGTGRPAPPGGKPPPGSQSPPE
jgi:type II secretory pathway pseudopilin PulG